jgi:hypothetical protein
MKTKTLSFLVKLLLLILSTVHDFLTDDPKPEDKTANNDQTPPAP